MKQATVCCTFRDKEEGVHRNVGDVFICSDERGAELSGYGLVWLKDAPEEKPKKRTRKVKK